MYLKLNVISSKKNFLEDSFFAYLFIWIVMILKHFCKVVWRCSQSGGIFNHCIIANFFSGCVIEIGRYLANMWTQVLCHLFMACGVEM